MGSLLPAFGQADQDPAVGNASAPRFTNPLFAGDDPDPTILRVGEDFYASYTSNTYSPGLMVWHSRDLVNWTPIEHAINDSHGGEIWAPDLIEHDGCFFIYFVMAAFGSYFMRGTGRVRLQPERAAGRLPGRAPGAFGKRSW